MSSRPSLSKSISAAPEPIDSGMKYVPLAPESWIKFKPEAVVASANHGATLAVFSVEGDSDGPQPVRRIVGARISKPKLPAKFFVEATLQGDRLLPADAIQSCAAASDRGRSRRLRTSVVRLRVIGWGSFSAANSLEGPSVGGNRGAANHFICEIAAPSSRGCWRRASPNRSRQ